MMELSDYRRGLFQWDTGRSLIVTEKDITEVHFQLLPPPSGSTETTDVPVSAGIAKIPDERLRGGIGGRLIPPYFCAKKKRRSPRLFFWIGRYAFDFLQSPPHTRGLGIARSHI